MNEIYRQVIQNTKNEWVHQMNKFDYYSFITSSINKVKRGMLITIGEINHVSDNLDHLVHAVCNPDFNSHNLFINYLRVGDFKDAKLCADVINKKLLFVYLDFVNNIIPEEYQPKTFKL